MQNDINIIAAEDANRQAIIALLQLEKLPVDDLPPLLANFFMAVDGDNVVAAVGLEVYGQHGLLRSLVVTTAYRNQAIAAKLVDAIEGKGKELHLEGIYLLTETAKEYFERKGYEVITRSDVPEAVKQSSEFSHVCPTSAVVMRKKIS